MTAANETSPRRWSVDSTPWLSPDIRPRMYDADEIVEGVTGRVAALLYQIIEYRMMYYVARLAILDGDPHHPNVLFRPPDLGCEVAGVRWHADDRFLTVNVGMSRKTLWRTNYVVAPCVFDLSTRTFTFLPLSNFSYKHLRRSNGGWAVDPCNRRPTSLPPHADESFRDHDLRWLAWEELGSRSERFFDGSFGTPG